MRYFLLVSFLFGCGAPPEESFPTPSGFKTSEPEPEEPEPVPEEPRSVVQPLSQFVVAGGVELGRLVAVNAWTLSIWDEERGLLYDVNDTTGYLAGDMVRLYAEEEDCSGSLYSEDWRHCGLPIPARRTVSRWPSDTQGLTEAAALYSITGGAVEYHQLMQDLHDVCILAGSASGSMYCGYEYGVLTDLPTTFELPIGIVERVQNTVVEESNE